MNTNIQARVAAIKSSMPPPPAGTGGPAVAAASPDESGKASDKFIDLAAEVYVSAQKAEQAANRVEAAATRIEREVPEATTRAIHGAVEGLHSAISDVRNLVEILKPYIVSAAAARSDREENTRIACIIAGLSGLAVLIVAAVRTIW